MLPGCPPGPGSIIGTVEAMLETSPGGSSAPVAGQAGAGLKEVPDALEAIVDSTPPGPVLDLVVPVYNEVQVLGDSIRTLADRLEELPYSWRITIADNASTDGTWDVASYLASVVSGVRALHLDQKGRGLALRTAWSFSDADIVAYTDVDLSTDLAALLPLIAPLITGHSDVAIGTRLGRGARVVRGSYREFVSRTYNRILRLLARARFSDAQCGFKAVRADAAAKLLPLVENDNWFFDTELLLLSERNGLRIHEVPVDWVDDPDSRVDVVATALEDLRGLARVGRRIARGEFRVPSGAHGAERDRSLWRQLGVFSVVGAMTTVLHVGAFALWRDALGNQLANALALALATVVNTFANGRFAFGKRGRGGWVRAQAEAASVFLFGLALTAAAIGVLDLAWPEAPTPAAVTVVLVGNGLATLCRFIAMRSWIFNPERRHLQETLR